MEQGPISKTRWDVATYLMACNTDPNREESDFRRLLAMDEKQLAGLAWDACRHLGLQDPATVLLCPFIHTPRTVGSARAVLEAVLAVTTGVAFPVGSPMNALSAVCAGTEPAWQAVAYRRAANVYGRDPLTDGWDDPRDN